MMTDDQRPLHCVNCGREIEPDDDAFGHVAAAFPDDDPRALEFWKDPCPSPEPPDHWFRAAPNGCLTLSLVVRRR